MELRVAVLLQVVVGGVLWGAPAPAASTPAAPADAGELEGDAARRRDRAFFPREAVEIHDGDLAAEQSSARRRRHGSDAVGAHHRNRLAVVVKRDVRTERGIEVEEPVRITEPARAGIDEAGRRRRVDEARIHLGAGRVDHLRALWHARVRADRFDDPVAHHDGPAFDWRLRNRKDLRVGNRDDATRRRPRALNLLLQGGPDIVSRAAIAGLPAPRSTEGKGPRYIGVRSVVVRARPVRPSILTRTRRLGGR